MISLLVGLVVTWMFLYGLVEPLQGPVARALNGLDLSWLAGMLTAGLLYYSLYKLGVGTPRRDGTRRDDPRETVGEPAGAQRQDSSGG
jgi:hypothetical protein